MIYFTVDEIELVHMQILDTSGGGYGTRDRGRLASAVAAQTQEVFGEVLYKTIFDKAAAHAKGLIADHPFTDGNKRTGIMVALILLERNGYVTLIKDMELEDFAVQIAVDHLDVTDISSWLKVHTK
jgi:death on curing protein